MSSQRGSSDASRTPHSLSLKVLRLARPTLTTQHTLPKQLETAPSHLPPIAGADPLQANGDDQFILTPSLKLPSAFGAVHVGETFTCTLCVNNDLPDDEDTRISNVTIAAEIQTPAQNEAPVPLDLEGAAASHEQSPTLNPSDTIQRIVYFHLADEGNYVLFATVNYTETQVPTEEDEKPIVRHRSFRKLYRFPADHLLRVRIKTRPLPAHLKKAVGRGHAVEAQLEKMGDESLVLESVAFNARAAFDVRSLNHWDAEGEGTARPMLEAGDVLQVAFLLLQNGQEDELDGDGKVVLGQMTIKWRREMGEPGMLNTGMITGRRS